MRDRAKRRKFTRDYKPTFRLSKLGITVAAAGLVLVLGLLYLSQSNQMATSGYDIAKLESQQKQLREDNERLQIEASRLQSIQQIDTGIKDSGMVPVKSINYLPGGTNVALNVK
jgi:Tfp pilus assembly protein PilN